MLFNIETRDNWYMILQMLCLQNNRKCGNTLNSSECQNKYCDEQYKLFNLYCMYFILYVF